MVQPNATKISDIFGNFHSNSKLGSLGPLGLYLVM